jgi:hypothetical protein
VSRRHLAIGGGIAGAVLLALIAGLVLAIARSGQSAKTTQAAVKVVTIVVPAATVAAVAPVADAGTPAPITTATPPPAPTPQPPTPTPTPAPTPHPLTAAMVGVPSQAITCHPSPDDSDTTGQAIQPGTVLTFDQLFPPSPGVTWYAVAGQSCWVRATRDDPLEVYPDKSKATAALAKYAPAGTVLYQADWSGGLNGWPDNNGWKSFNGQYLNDGTCGGQVTAAPLSLSGVSDYAVEVDIQVIRGKAGYRFSIFARDGAYLANIWDDIVYGDHAELASKDGYLKDVRFNPGEAKHTYRLEVKGNSVRYLIDKNVMDEATDNKYLDSGKNGQVGLVCNGVQLVVTGFRVIKL